MKTPSRSFRKGLFVLLPLVILGVYAVHEANGNPDGITGQSKVGCGGSGCHGLKSTATIVSIRTDSAQIVTGRTYVFTVSVANVDEFAAGCDISVDSGKLATNGTGSGLRLIGKELTHSQPRVFDGDSAVWKFKYTARSTPGAVKFFLAGNAVDGNGNANSGDRWNTASFTFNVVAASGPQISTPSLARDTVLTGETKPMTVTIKNIGTAPLNISNISLKFGTSFHVAGTTPASLTPGQSADLTVNFAPTKPGLVTDTLHISSDDAGRPTASVILTGLGTAGVFNISANPKNFGQVKVGESSTATVVVINKGNARLIINGSLPTSTNPAFQFVSIVPLQLPPITLQPNDTVAVTFKYSPTAVGFDTTRLVFQLSNYTGEQHDSVVTVIGQGIPAASVHDREESANIVIAPNPSVGYVSITGITEPVELQVSDAAGRIVRNQQVMDNASLDLSGLPNGTYMIVIRTHAGDQIYRRIVIER
jgi:hypothetical protein